MATLTEVKTCHSAVLQQIKANKAQISLVEKKIVSLSLSSKCTDEMKDLYSALAELTKATNALHNIMGALSDAIALNTRVHKPSAKLTLVVK